MTTIKIKRASVLLRVGHNDFVFLTFDAKSTASKTGYEQSASFDVSAGDGVEWVRRNIGIEPEVIDARGNTLLKFSRE